MFFSHDILTNGQYGVATIWLAATIGKNSQKKLSRKAIQEVDVPKACDKIIHPEAPLALRLQGNLLYGVSRVFSQQCIYMLTDAERCRSDMLSYFRGLHQNELDPEAGKTKLHLITLDDDPAFDPMAALPKFDMLDWDLDAVLNTQTSSHKGYSQFTPLASQHSASSAKNVSNMSINLPDSSHGSIGLLDFGHSPAPYKPIQFPGAEASDLNLFGDDERLGIGLEIDANGNMIEIFGEEPELPLLPGMSNDPLVLGHNAPRGSDNDAEPFMVGEEAALPHAEAFPVNQAPGQTSIQRVGSASSEPQSTGSEQAAAPSRRGRRRKANVMLDTQEILSRVELKARERNYLKNMDTQRKRRKLNPLAQAKQIAAALVYGNGIADVGIAFDAEAQLVLPLAHEFSGDILRASLFGVDATGQRASAKGRRRGRSAAFGEDDDETDESRNAKHLKHDDAEVERFLHGSEGNPLIPEDMGPEMGMDEARAMADHHSSTMMPWSRAGSVVPGSSVRGSAKKPSPLAGRLGSVVHSIERHSDPGDQGMEDLGGHFPSANS